MPVRTWASAASSVTTNCVSGPMSQVAHSSRDPTQYAVPPANCICPTRTDRSASSSQHLYRCSAAGSARAVVRTTQSWRDHEMEPALTPSGWRSSTIRWSVASTRSTAATTFVSAVASASAAARRLAWSSVIHDAPTMTIRDAASPSHGASLRARRRAEPTRRASSETGAPPMPPSREAPAWAASWTAPITRARIDGGASIGSTASVAAAPSGGSASMTARPSFARCRGPPGSRGRWRGAREGQRPPGRSSGPALRAARARGAGPRSARGRRRGPSGSSVGLRRRNRPPAGPPRMSSGWSRSTTVPSRCRSWAIARRVRDLTVPSGHSRRSAIWACDRSMA